MQKSYWIVWDKQSEQFVSQPYEDMEDADMECLYEFESVLEIKVEVIS